MAKKIPGSVPQRWTFALRPTVEQHAEFVRRADVDRFVYNWAVAGFRVHDARWRCWRGWHPHLQALTVKPEALYGTQIVTHLLAEIAARPDDLGWLKAVPAVVRSGSALNATAALKRWRQDPARRHPVKALSLGWLIAHPQAIRSRRYVWTTTRAQRAAHRKGNPKQRRTPKGTGFPRFKSKAKARPRFDVGRDAIKIDPGREHVEIGRARRSFGGVDPGPVRSSKGLSKLARLVNAQPDDKGRARITGGSVSARNGRWELSIMTETRRPQDPKIAHPNVTVGVDVGVRCWAVVAVPAGVDFAVPDPDWAITEAAGWTIVRIPNPAALNKAQADLRVAQRQMDRRCGGKGCRLHGDHHIHRRPSRSWVEASDRVRRIHRRVADLRANRAHAVSAWLTQTFGGICVEDLNVVGMVAQKNAHGARRRRRDLGDAGLAQMLQQIAYKAQWSGCSVTEAGRYFPSSKTCHRCGEIQVIGWAEDWTCRGCGASHNRDENAAINLARLGGRNGAEAAPVAKLAVGPVLRSAADPAGSAGKPSGMAA